MLSLQQAYEIKESILAYLKATFTFQDKQVHKAFYEFITDEHTGIFKGPYVSIKLPFVKANAEDIASIPLTIKPSWPPYDHQVKSWHRLSTANGHQPQPTIVTTGTGSGKTESFLYPILDYCYQNRHRPGIKVIILYPMNALATDQAKRLAEAIFEDPRLKGAITAGLFIGEGRDNKKYPKTMGADHIIENRNAIVDAPPDILLTNFKMLDYGLMRHQFHSLWTHNFKDAELLKFLILDELHTYDGAKGTDVANLIRRLKLKLSIPEGQLCPVGTSATIGSGPDAPRLLAEYATKVFGVPFTPDAIITEKRLGLDEFFHHKERDELDDQWVGSNSLRRSVLQANENYAHYKKRQLKLWGLDEKIPPQELGEWLQNKLIVYDLLKVCQVNIKTVDEVIRKLSESNEEFKRLSQWDEEGRFNPKEAVLQSLLALITEAKSGGGDKLSPFLYVSVQLWIREFSGLLRQFSATPAFTWKDEIAKGMDMQALPPWFCRECGASGWLGEKHDNKNRFEKDVNDVYKKFFTNHKHIFFINTPEHPCIEEHEASEALHSHVNVSSLEFQENAAGNSIDIIAHKKLDRYGKNDHVCPECNTRNTVSIIGTRIATLSSIAVSQVLATDLDDQPEKDRKVLAFTNSVQDAAHQAGFVEARNYRFTFRASLQNIIKQQAAPIHLSKLTQAFIDHWKQHSDESGQAPLDAYFYRFFPSDYIGKANPADYHEKGKYTAVFQKEFDQRIHWEIYSEFGYNALIGRTLEKTGSSAVFFDSQALEDSWQAMQSWLDSNNMGHVKQEEFLKFLTLMLHRVRTRGGVAHPYFEKFRSNDLKLWELNWNRDQRHFLNRKFGPRTRLPRLLTAERDFSGRGLLDTTHARNLNWFHAYFRKSFPMAPGGTDVVNEFYQHLLEALVKANILDVARSKSGPNHAINPVMVYVQNQVNIHECDQCGHQLYSSGNDEWINTGNCTVYRCTGHYKMQANTIASNYYQLVYNRTRSPRIYAADHTGLLERKDREQKENDFKDRSKFNSLNALVATSTLEMGIDIGTLNTVMNNAVPPYTSNFLQRVGRAGRARGSSLVINFAQSEAHDLFYFAEPKDMMEGEISSPGCYLEAREILKRHYFAFCIDSWTSKNPKENEIPRLIRFIKIANCDLQAPAFFMNRILSFMKANEDNLYRTFISQYQQEVNQSVLDELYNALKSESLYEFCKSIFGRLQKEVQFIQQKRKDIDAHIKEQKLGAEDPERIKLDREKTSLGGILSSINKRSTLEHLTNVGALPNYAFPETGITLNAKVMGQQAVASTKPPLNKDFEIIRSSKQAIRELAPNNYFYSQGFKLKVTGVNTFDWADQAVFHEKRFCSNCDHIDDAITAQKGPCPKCGDGSWGADSNIHKFAKLTTVRSFNNQSDAALTDGGDDRDKEIFRISRHFSFDARTSQGAWAMKKVPFGIEYVKQVQITEVNLGKTDVVSARKLILNGWEVPVYGFITCRHCGKSTSNFHKKDYKFHYGFCKHHEKEYQGKTDEVFEEVFFFRNITTEALKILIPVQEFESDAEIMQFKAGIQLGLKKYYQGNPQHIEIDDYREYNHRTSKFDRYLVLYDTIPGGTGYLEKLFDRREFNQLLNDAYVAIKECFCQHHGKDGCYRCIYTYSNQFYRQDLSRERAEKRFYQIIRQDEGWEHQPHGLGTITNAGQIEESELEERFIRSLKRKAEAEGWTFESVNEYGIINYNLTIKNEQAEIIYRIRPQVELGPSNGIKYFTRSDFLIACIAFKKNGSPLPHDEMMKIPRFAVYLDGYQFHASEERNHFERDLLKRQSIIHSPEYQTWILTWEDMELFDAGKEDNLSALLGQPPFSKTKNEIKKGFKIPAHPFESAKNNLERLIAVLHQPALDTGFCKRISLFMAYFQKKRFVPSFPENEKERLLNFSHTIDLSSAYIVDQETLKQGVVLFQGVLDNELFATRILVNIIGGELYANFRLNNLKIIQREDWEKFWRLFNICQFFALHISDATLSEEVSIDRKEEATLDTDQILQEVLALFASEYHELIKLLNEKGYLELAGENEEKLNSLMDENGKIIAEAELVVPSKKWVFDPFSEEDSMAFEKEGYQVVSIHDFDLSILENETTHLR